MLVEKVYNWPPMRSHIHSLSHMHSHAHSHILAHTHSTNHNKNVVKSSRKIFLCEVFSINRTANSPLDVSAVESSFTGPGILTVYLPSFQNWDKNWKWAIRSIGVFLRRPRQFANLSQLPNLGQFADPTVHRLTVCQPTACQPTVCWSILSGLVNDDVY